jgi:glycosyltransferase involved in cell wall biosynthesis
MKTKIACTHLLNDYSGSPLVFRQDVRLLLEQGHEVDLYTSCSKGFLSELARARYQPFYYFWSPNKLLTLLNYLMSQVQLFCSILFRQHKYKAVYINSVLPFGAALAGKCCGIPVIYHLHETSIKPRLLKHFLFGIVNMTASEVIYVSHYLKNEQALSRPQSRVIYNSLPADFEEKAIQHSPATNRNFLILMLCSLKVYKGVWEFLTLARKLPQYRFSLVLNAREKEVASFFKGHELPSNLRLYAAQPNVHPFYQEASLVVNFSRPEEWVETFGMTIAEGMYYGKPVIVPPVGGVTELVEEGQNGFLTNSRDTERLISQINLLASDPKLYQQFSSKAREAARQFSSERFSENLLQLFDPLLAQGPSRPRKFSPISWKEDIMSA